MRPLHILHVAPTVSIADGVSLAVIAMLHALVDEPGLRVHLLTGKYSGLPLNSTLSSHRMASVEVLPVFQPLGGRLGFSVAYPPDFAKTISTLARSADLVHLHGVWLYPTLVGGPILRRLRTPYVISPHGSLMSDALRRRRLKKSLALALGERKNIDAAEALIATSEAELRHLRAIGFRAPGDIVPLAVDPRAIMYFSRHHVSLGAFRARRRRTLLCVSRFHSRKRLVELVAAFSDVSQAFPEWLLRIVGPDDERGYRGRVLAAARGSRAPLRISVESALEGEALWIAYLDADIFALVSDFENFGLVIGEALAAGRPAITTRGAPWPQLIIKECGWWIDPSLESLRPTLHEAMSASPDMLWEMGQRGRRLVAEEYSLSALGSGLSAIYGAVSAQRDRSEP